MMMVPEDQSMTPSISRTDMIYEISYFKRLGIVHKSVLFFYCRDRNHSLSLAKKIRIELSRLYLAEEVKDAVRVITRTSMSPDHHGIDIVIADVDHTTVRVLECLNKRAKASETRRLPCIPVILLMPDSLDEDMRSNLHNVGGYDVILPSSISTRELFNTLTDLLYRRTIVESAYNDLRKEQRNLKYPHLQIFEDEKLPLHHLTVDEEDEEEEEDGEEGDQINPSAIRPSNSTDSPSEPHYGDDFDDYGSYDFDDHMNPNSLFFDGGGGGGDLSTLEDHSVELHPPSIVELRNYYSRIKKKRITSNNNTASSNAIPSITNNGNGNVPRILDPKERQILDKFIVKTISKENNMDMRDGSDSDEEGTSKLATVSEVAEEKVITRRTGVKASEKPLPAGPGGVGGAGAGPGGRNKFYYRSDSINIMDESHRPAWKHGHDQPNEMNATESASTIGADILPFVDRRRPDMSKPTTVAGMNKKTALACWKVLHTKDKFGPGYMEHKHDRPWTTSKVQKDLRSQLDGSGTYKVTVMKSMMKPIQRSFPDKDRNVPVELKWEPPTRYISSTKNKRRFYNELRSTKLRLRTLESKTKQTPPPFAHSVSLTSSHSAVSTGSLGPKKSIVAIPKTPTAVNESNLPSAPSTPAAIAGATSASGAGAGTNSATVNFNIDPPPPTSPTSTPTPTPITTSLPPQISPEKVSVIREWRGFAETNTHDESGKRTSVLKLSGLLRSAGGIQFGNIITGVKARLKARRLVKDFTAFAKPDPETSKLILINFDNRRIGSGEREHLIQGINLQNNNQLYAAIKSFSKAILVCKQLHLPTICRGIVQFQRGKFFSAIKDFTEAIKFIESSQEKINLYRLDLSIARFNRGMTYFRLGDDERGIEDMEYAIECDPDNIHIREILVLIYRRSNDYIPAIDHCIQLHELQNQIKQVETRENKLIHDEEIHKRLELNTTNELMKGLDTVEKTTHQIRPASMLSMKRKSPDVRKITTAATSRRPGSKLNMTTTNFSSNPNGGGGGQAGDGNRGVRPSTALPPTHTSHPISPLSLVNSRIQASTWSTLPYPDDSALADRSGSVVGHPVVNRIEISEYQFPSLRDKKNEYIQKKQLEEKSQESVFLDSFKHAHGFKKHLYDSLFICLSPLQDALITLPSQRSVQQLQLISKTLKSFPMFSHNNENELSDLAACIEYRTITSKSTLFYQDDPVDALILVLTGQLQLKLESGQHTQILGILNPYECYGEISLLFRNKYSEFLENLHRVCLDDTVEFNLTVDENRDNEEENDNDQDGGRDDNGPGNGHGNGHGNGISMNKSMTLDKFDKIESYPRSLQPGSFMSCKVSSPSELLLIHSHDFDRMLREHFEKQFHERIHLLNSSHLFQGIFSRHEIVRLARMSVLRHYHQGDVILSQGDKPEFLYFVLNGVCRVMKKPDPTESLVRKLGELKDMALNYDQKYVFHHRLRGTFKPSSTTAAAAAAAAAAATTTTTTNTSSSAPIMAANTATSHQIGYKTAAEEDRENLTIEIKKLEIQVAKEKQLEARRQEEEDELRRLGRKLPNKSVHISTIFWPQLFGESCILQPDVGTSLGTIIAETVCDILCIHRIHLQTFHIDENLLQRVKDRSVHYPLDDILVQMLESNIHWNEFKKELIEQLPKDKWPKKKKV